MALKAAMVAYGVPVKGSRYLQPCSRETGGMCACGEAEMGWDGREVVTGHLAGRPVIGHTERRGSATDQPTPTLQSLHCSEVSRVKKTER